MLEQIDIGEVGISMKHMLECMVDCGADDASSSS